MLGLLECVNVDKSYGGVTALLGINLSCEGGEILGLVGPNGAGKSTLIDIITGVERQTGGQVLLAGKSLSGPSWKRARMGLTRTFQHPQLANELSLAENIAVGFAGPRLYSTASVVKASFMDVLKASGRWRSQVGALATELGLKDIDRRAGEVAFADARMTEIARALTGRPSVVLLDEPFQGIEHDQISRVLDILRRMRAANVCVILVDHNVDLVASVVDRVALLIGGAIVLDASPSECWNSAVFQEEYLGLT